MYVHFRLSARVALFLRSSQRLIVQIWMILTRCKKRRNLNVRKEITTEKILLSYQTPHVLTKDIEIQFPSQMTIPLRILCTYTYTPNVAIMFRG